ncbi:hypothetical protein BDR04DRAFT_1177456 [Suillus decipiens]|nr:hypothetical protein BDR04DRAFT_1177456 [Suillus decipiens]
MTHLSCPAPVTTTSPVPPDGHVQSYSDYGVILLLNLFKSLCGSGATPNIGWEADMNRMGSNTLGHRCGTSRAHLSHSFVGLSQWLLASFGSWPWLEIWYRVQFEKVQAQTQPDAMLPLPLSALNHAMQMQGRKLEVPEAAPHPPLIAYLLGIMYHTLTLALNCLEQLNVSDGSSAKTPARCKLDPMTISFTVNLSAAVAITSPGGFYTTMPRLVYRTAYFAGGKDGNILITKGQDNDEEFIIRSVFQISRNNFHFTPDTNYDPANVFHGRLADLKLHCQLTAGRNEAFKFSSKDFSAICENLNTFKKSVPRPRYYEMHSVIWDTIGHRSIKLTHCLFQDEADNDTGSSDSNGNGDGNSSTCTVYDKDHILIPPLQYEEKLKGALIEAHFAFCHHCMKDSKCDIFEAILCPPATLNATTSAMGLVLNSATGGNIKLVQPDLHLKLNIIVQPAQDTVQDM